MRSELVAALASDAVLERYNELAYGANREYRADAEEFRTYLFPWEEHVVAEYFPPPPARLLIGGAGGGRESFALAGMGHRIVAFEPSAPLAATLAAAVPDGCDVQTYRASYQDLPELFPASQGGRATRLGELGPFDASILGWGSFSHLAREESRIRTLSAFGAVTDGPIVISFLALRQVGAAQRKLARLRTRLPRRPGRLSGDRFSPSIGYYHPIDRPELERLAAAAGLEVRYLNFDERETTWPHTVLYRAGSAGN
jgi:hypothetical protein